MALDKCKLPIINGPSLFELMLAHYDPEPSNLTGLGVSRFVRFTVQGNFEDEAFRQAVDNEIGLKDAADMHIHILGTRRSHRWETKWNFQGERRASKFGLYPKYRVVGTYNTKNRTGEIKFFKVE